MKWQKLAVGSIALFAITGVVVLGCGSSSSSDDNNLPINPAKDGSASNTADGSGNQTICLLNDCDLDRDCQDCTGGQTVCDQSAHHCVACGANAGGVNNCTAGTACTPYGNCAPTGETCATDTSGNPTITCKTNTDCAACDPKHQVCDGAKCVGCTPADVINCQSTDTCDATGTCAAKCPASCTADSDCGLCNNTAGGIPANACNKHICSQCSATKACASGSCDLDHGTCTPSCGLSGGHQAVGNPECSTDTDCKGCKTTTSCQLNIGSSTGSCVVPATGCSDLGKGTTALPAPFNEVTNTCSSDTDCASVNANIDIGAILKSLTGFSINSAVIQYPMHVCADITIKGPGGTGGDAGSSGISCGLCVPCRVDTDCSDIDIDQVAGQAFGPIGSIAASLLLDQVFGPNDHKVHMYCQSVAEGYGVCAPCADILSSCGDGKSGTPTATTCGHDACAEGAALSPTCDPSATDVCAHDSYCCTDEWDQLCIDEVDEYSKTQACTPVSCDYKDDGTYCTPAGTGKNPGTTNSGFVCENHSIEGGTVGCAIAGQKCEPSDPANLKSPAKTQAAGDGGTTIVCQ